MDYYKKVISNYAVFSGRARRKEYWMFLLVNIVIMVILGVIEKITGIESFLVGIYSLAILIPSIAVTFRRLHDTGRSAWWLLIGLVPFIGAIVLIVFYAQDSQPGTNQYGANPKESDVVPATPAPMV